MKWTEIKVVFNSENPGLSIDLISGIFYDLGLKGVVIEDPDMEPEEGWGEGYCNQTDGYAVIGYFPKNKDSINKINLIESRLNNLSNTLEIFSEILSREIDEEDWAHSWKAFFKPEKVSDQIVIKPTWQEYKPGLNEIVVEIDPGMAFGTGTHPTTSMCIKMIEKYLRPNHSFLDIGTGSGILMVVAAAFGSTTIMGIDNDQVAVEIAEKNLTLNNIDKDIFHIEQGNLADRISSRFDIVTANILSEVIIILLDNVKDVLKPDGLFICSGIIEKNKEAILIKMENLNFKIVEIMNRENWVTIAGRSV